MTNKIALALFAIIVLAGAVDLYLFNGVALIAIARKFVELIQYLAFWR